MRDPREFGHEPEADAECECGCGDVSCAYCGDLWPCTPVRKYDEKVAARERRRGLPDELDKITARVAKLERCIAEYERIIREHEKFFAGAVMPVIRDLLATHATGSLSVPNIMLSQDHTDVDAFKGIGPKFKASGGYVYEATDGRVYTDGKVTRGASVAKASEQLRRFNG